MGLRHPERADTRGRCDKADASEATRARTVAAGVDFAVTSFEPAHAAFFRPGLIERSTPPHTPQRSSRRSAVSRQTVRTRQWSHSITAMARSPNHKWCEVWSEQCVLSPRSARPRSAMVGASTVIAVKVLNLPYCRNSYLPYYQE
jgi:hypothetical protein